MKEIFLKDVQWPPGAFFLPIGPVDTECPHISAWFAMFWDNGNRYRLAKLLHCEQGS